MVLSVQTVKILHQGLHYLPNITLRVSGLQRLKIVLKNDLVIYVTYGIVLIVFLFSCFNFQLIPVSNTFLMFLSFNLLPSF